MGQNLEYMLVDGYVARNKEGSCRDARSEGRARQGALYQTAVARNGSKSANNCTATRLLCDEQQVHNKLVRFTLDQTELVVPICQTVESDFAKVELQFRLE